MNKRSGCFHLGKIKLCMCTSPLAYIEKSTGGYNDFTVIKVCAEPIYLLLGYLHFFSESLSLYYLSNEKRAIVGSQLLFVEGIYNRSISKDCFFKFGVTYWWL